MNGEVEKGLLTLISSDSPGIQVPFFFLVIMVSERLVNLQMMSFASFCFNVSSKQKDDLLHDFCKLLVQTVFWFRYVTPMVVGT